ncbi:hypothetical protein MYVA_0702 [Mycolicibacterium vaccae 95051]|nr:hypothetical protein MYVA_0702 [Mycolicibacterium vaccae 95051]
MRRIDAGRVGAGFPGQASIRHADHGDMNETLSNVVKVPSGTTRQRNVARHPF